MPPMGLTMLSVAHKLLASAIRQLSKNNLLFDIAMKVLPVKVRRGNHGMETIYMERILVVML